jgi:hypothetical protein
MSEKTVCTCDCCGKEKPADEEIEKACMAAKGSYSSDDFWVETDIVVKRYGSHTKGCRKTNHYCAVCWKTFQKDLKHFGVWL